MEAHIAGRDGRGDLFTHFPGHENAGERAAVLETPGGILSFVLEHQALNAGKGFETVASVRERCIAFTEGNRGIHGFEREEPGEALPEVGASLRAGMFDASDGNFERFAVLGKFLDLFERMFLTRDCGNEFAHGNRA
jgi:hypothetical protein